jgi:predicted nucleotidyltransferase
MAKMTASDDFTALASVLADWATGAPGFKLYLFGSRVRGDHRSDSDVDLSVEFAVIGDREMDWWMSNNQDEFSSINTKLPGKLHILEENDPVTRKVRSGPVLHQDRNVLCVWLPPSL